MRSLPKTDSPFTLYSSKTLVIVRFMSVMLITSRFGCRSLIHVCGKGVHRSKGLP